MVISGYNKHEAWDKAPSGYGVNIHGGQFRQGGAYSYEKRLEIAREYTDAKAKQDGGKRPDISAIAKKCQVSWHFVKKVEKELQSYGRVLKDAERKKFNKLKKVSAVPGAAGSAAASGYKSKSGEGSADNAPAIGGAAATRHGKPAFEDVQEVVERARREGKMVSNADERRQAEAERTSRLAESTKVDAVSNNSAGMEGLAVPVVAAAIPTIEAAPRKADTDEPVTLQSTDAMWQETSPLHRSEEATLQSSLPAEFVVPRPLQLAPPVAEETEEATDETVDATKKRGREEDPSTFAQWKGRKRASK